MVQRTRLVVAFWVTVTDASGTCSKEKGLGTCCFRSWSNWNSLQRHSGSIWPSEVPIFELNAFFSLPDFLACNVRKTSEDWPGRLPYYYWHRVLRSKGGCKLSANLIWGLVQAMQRQWLPKCIYMYSKWLSNNKIKRFHWSSLWF